MLFWIWHLYLSQFAKRQNVLKYTNKDFHFCIFVFFFLMLLLMRMDWIQSIHFCLIQFSKPLISWRYVPPNCLFWVCLNGSTNPAVHSPACKFARARGNTDCSKTSKMKIFCSAAILDIFIPTLLLPAHFHWSVQGNFTFKNISLLETR